MEIARFRRLSRVAFFLGAMVMFFGLGFYAMGYEAAGIVLLIAGLVVAMLTFSVTRFFMMFDMMHMTDRRRQRKSGEEDSGDGPGS